MNNEVKVLEREREEWVDQTLLKVLKRSSEDDLEIIKSYFDDRGWDWDVAGFGMITSPFYDGKYYYLPEHLDKTIIPQEGLQRLKAVKELGIEIQGVIIGHEVKKPAKKRVVDIDWTELGQQVRGVAKTTAMVTGAVVGGIGSVLLSGVATTAESVFDLVDPMLIIVLNDSANTNVEIYWWLD